MAIDFSPAPLERRAFILAQYLPPGKIWRNKFDIGRNLGKLIFSLAREFVRIHDIISLFVTRELNPLTTKHFISEWEESLGIPDSCFGRAEDLTERRRVLFEKVNNFGNPITNEDIVAILASFGEAIEILPGSDDIADDLGFSTPVTDPGERKALRHTLAVRVESAADVFPLTFPLPLGSSQSTLVECLVSRLVAANLDIKFFYNQNLSIPL